MKEYEYIVLATNEVFTHLITSAICLENYFNDSNEGAFRNTFTMFNEFRMDYKETIKNAEVRNHDEVQLESARFKVKCRILREEIIKSFVKELQIINDTIDYEKEIQEYYNRIEKEDVETLELMLMIYPYLLSLVRKNEE